MIKNLVEIIMGDECEFGRLMVGKPVDRQLQ